MLLLQRSVQACPLVHLKQWRNLTVKEVKLLFVDSVPHAITHTLHVRTGPLILREKLVLLSLSSFIDLLVLLHCIPESSVFYFIMARGGRF